MGQMKNASPQPHGNTVTRVSPCVRSFFVISDRFFWLGSMACTRTRESYTLSSMQAVLTNSAPTSTTVIPGRSTLRNLELVSGS